MLLGSNDYRDKLLGTAQGSIFQEGREMCTFEKYAVLGELGTYNLINVWEHS